jgi:hypothetical protein
MTALPDSSLLATGLAMGLGATLAIDLWAQLLRRAAGIGSTDWSLVGRWVAGLGRGRLRLGKIGTEGLSRRDLLLGWSTHYAVGIAYALIYLALLQSMARDVSLSSALLFGGITVLAPWLILQPGLGKGWFASATPRPGATRLLNLATHLLFGAGLYFSGQLAALLDY